MKSQGAITLYLVSTNQELLNILLLCFPLYLECKFMVIGGHLRGTFP